MKQQELVRVVEEKFRIINKLSRKTILEFNSDVIHDFRHEVKQLRSFLRLISYSQPLHLSFSLPKKLKKFYGYVGIVRNLQIQQALVNDFCERQSLPLPANYLNILAAEEIFWRNEGRLFIEDAKQFYEDERTVVDAMPSCLKAVHGQSFVSDKMAEVHKLHNRLHDDDAIHKTRKLLKDVLYNWNYLPVHNDAYRSYNECYQVLKELTDEMGRFRDVCISINHLQAAYIDRIKNPGEKKLLQQIEANWQLEKERIKESITRQLTTTGCLQEMPAAAMEHSGVLARLVSI